MLHVNLVPEELVCGAVMYCLLAVIATALCGQDL